MIFFFTDSAEGGHITVKEFFKAAEDGTNGS